MVLENKFGAYPNLKGDFMRILFINSVVDYGSTGKIVRDLANGLIQHGHDVKIAYGRMSSKEAVNTIDISNRFQSAWHLVMTRLLGRHGLHSSSATKKLIKEIELFNPDVIHLHNLHGYYLNVEMLLNYLKTRKARIILTLHDCWLFSGSGAYFDYHGCKIWDKGCVECNSTSDYPQQVFPVRQKKNFKWKERVLTGFDDLTIVTPSLWLTELANQTFLSQYSIETINNGIDLEVFQPQEATDQANDLSIADSDCVLLGATNIWEPRKGLNYLYQLSKHLNSNQKLIIVGLNKKQMAEVPANVIGLMRTASLQELKGLYSRADVFLNPTLEDNFPTSNLEALACGTPVLTFDTGGSAESIDDSTGWVVERANEKSFIEVACSVKRKSTNVSERCRNRALDYYSKEQMIKAYTDLILK